MPEEAWEILSETLVMDSQSSHIDRALRDSISEAYEQVEHVDISIRADVLNAMDAIACMKYPSIASTLEYVGYKYEAECLIKLIDAYENYRDALKEAKSEKSQAK